MPSSSPRVWLTDIREEIAGIRTLTKDADLETFAKSWAMKRAVQHALLIIAEAAKHLPEAMKAAHSDVPWQRIHDPGMLTFRAFGIDCPSRAWGLVPAPVSR